MLMYRAKPFYTSNAQLGSYQLNTYATGLYWRYTATRGWYTNTTLQLARYSGQVESNNSTRKPDISWSWADSGF